MKPMEWSPKQLQRENLCHILLPTTLILIRHLQSAPFSFFVGDMGWRFPMPRKLVGAHSRRLKRSMLRRSKMELPDVDANTFIRFIEYMFTGRYSDPQKYFEPSTRAGNTPKEDNTVDERGIIKPLDNSITSETPDYFSAIEHSQPHVVVPGDRYLTSPAGATQADSDIRTLEAFRSADFVQNKSKIIAPLTAIVCWKKRAHHVLIAHARVYFFAGEYGIEGLKAVALRKLQRALCMWLDEHQALKRLDIDAVQSFVQVQASSASWNASAIVTLLGTAVEVRRLSTRDTSE